MYFATVDLSRGTLLQLELTPMQSNQFRLTRPAAADVKWLEDTFNSTGAPLGTSVELVAGRLKVVF